MSAIASLATLTLSRQACVAVSSTANNSRGSGFLIGPRHVVTCFHVAAQVTAEKNLVKWSLPTDLVVNLDGESIPARCISVPTDSEPDPLVRDFAVLELASPPKGPHTPLRLASGRDTISLGDEVVFSGYPLGVPAMVTHKGFVSGWTDSQEVVCIQAPINKGNSGGALLSQAGEVIGLVSMREGGISQGLAELSDFIATTSAHGSVTLMGVDPLQSIRAITQTLDTYISTGIGYARNISHLRQYLERHPIR